MNKKFKTYISRLSVRISPRLFFSLSYLHNRGRLPNLLNPKDLSEILVKRVLNGEINRYSYLADKHAVREYVISKGLGSILTPLIGVYTDVNQIKFEELPNKFALKMNFGAGMNVICTDKSKLDINKTKNKLHLWINSPQTYSLSEKHYNLIPHKIVCEQFIDDGTGGFPYDYKFMCIHGKPVCVLACSGRGTANKHLAPYDMEWNPVPQYDKLHRAIQIDCPSNFEEMKEIAMKLSDGIDFVRVDLYSNGEQVWFGEMTLTPAGCILHGWTKLALDEMGKLYLDGKKN